MDLDADNKYYENGYHNSHPFSIVGVYYHPNYTNVVMDITDYSKIIVEPGTSTWLIGSVEQPQYYAYQGNVLRDEDNDGIISLEDYNYVMIPIDSVGQQAGGSNVNWRFE